jgi:hypothetical protein
MRLGAFEIHEPVPELREPYVLASLRPWVDVGSVGTLVLGRLERHLGAQELGRLRRPGVFFDFTRYRPTVFMKDGQREFSIPNTVINWARGPGGHDFILLHMLEPQMFGELYVASVQKVLQHFKAQRYCLLGSMYDAVPHTRPLLITGSAVGPLVEEQMKRIQVEASSYQGPTTITMLIAREAPKRGTETMSLIIHLPQYVQLDEDHAGEARAMEAVCSLFDLPRDLVDTAEGEAQYKEISRAVEGNTQVRGVVRQLESAYDSEHRQQPPMPPSPPNETKLSPEVEKFLRDIDKGFRGN